MIRRYVPTKSNRQAWALEKEIATLILRLVKEREKGGYENDLLQTILEGARYSTTAHHGQEKETDRFIVDNCKNILLAAYETTAFPASWCLMLLAANPDWQERVRTEVIQVCRDHIPDADMLRKMKQVLIYTLHLSQKSTCVFVCYADVYKLFEQLYDYLHQWCSLAFLCLVCVAIAKTNFFLFRFSDFNPKGQHISV